MGKELVVRDLFVRFEWSHGMVIVTNDGYPVDQVYYGQVERPSKEEFVEWVLDYQDSSRYIDAMDTFRARRALRFANA